jgi:hypothetical protein
MLLVLSQCFQYLPHFGYAAAIICILCVLCMWSGVISTPEGSDDEALRKLFMRIDANCDATVEWCAAAHLCSAAPMHVSIHHCRQLRC